MTFRYPDPSLYEIENADEVFSPGLVIFRELLEHNLKEMIRIAGDPVRLRPHCKTHKTREIIQMAVELGITKHKCATIAEAEMLGDVGVKDVLLAYQVVGPNLRRLVQLVDKFPETKFICIVDHPSAVSLLSNALASQDSDQRKARSVEVMLGLNSGMNRTGISLGENAIELYEMILAADCLKLGGLHWYDGHHRQPDLAERTGMVNAGWDRLTRFRDQLMLSGLNVPRLVAAGTGSFPILANQGEPNLELSPGTTVLHDDDMAVRFPEMNFIPSAGILTRVVSKGSGRLTLDVGHKSCAADQPFGKRLFFPSLSDASEVLHSEEHLVIESANSGRFRLGDAIVAISRHACPVSAVHQFATVVENGKATGRWKIAARDRVLTI